MHGQPYIKIQNNISYNSFNRFQIPKSRRTGRHTKGNRRIFCIFALFAMRKKNSSVSLLFRRRYRSLFVPFTIK